MSEEYSLNRLYQNFYSKHIPVFFVKGKLLLLLHGNQQLLWWPRSPTSCHTTAHPGNTATATCVGRRMQPELGLVTGKKDLIPCHLIPCHLVIVSFGLPLPQGRRCTYGWLWETRLHKLRACGFRGFLLFEQVCYSGSNSVQGKEVLWLRPNLCFFSLRKVNLSSGSGLLCPCL